MAGLDLPLIVPAIRLDRDASVETSLALRRAKLPWVAGFLLFGGKAEQVATLTDQLRDAARRPLFVASDMERGAGQQVQGLRVLPQPGIWGLGATPSEAEALGEITARDARSVGVDVVCAPVVDVRSEPANPIVGNRAFGWEPGRVTALAQAYVRGALRGGVLPIAKHYPGHGPTTEDSHDALPVVDEPEHRIRRRDMAPFLEVVHTGGCPGVMTAHVHYSTLDSASKIATISRRILRPLFRPAGDVEPPVIFTDALIMAAALVSGSERDAARQALAAGCDALLYPDDPEGLARTFFAEGDALPSASSGVLTGRPRTTLRQRAERSAERLIAFATRAQDLEEPPAETPELAQIPLTVSRRALELSGASTLRPEGEMLIVLDDDSKPDRGQILAQEARKRGVRAHVIEVKEGELPIASAFGDTCTVVTISGVAAWKGSAGISGRADSLQLGLVQTARDQGCDLQWVSMTPLVGWSGLHIPGTGPAVEEALVELLFPDA